MDDGLLEGVDRWLEKSGHAFELRVARAFREGGARPVDLSFSYTDATTGMLREGDVLSHFRWKARNDIPASIEVVIECMAGRDHPWVAFQDRTLARASRLSDWTYFTHGPFTGVTDPLDSIWVGHPPFDVLQVASHLVTAHEKDSRNPAGDSIRQVLSAAEGRRRRYLDRQNQDSRGCVILPVVVTAGRLVSCSLSRSGSLETQEVASAVVAGPRAGETPARVFVLTEPAIPEFAGSLVALVTRADEEARFPN